MSWLREVRGGLIQKREVARQYLRLGNVILSAALTAATNNH